MDEPTFEEVESVFVERLKSKEISHECAIRFYRYNVKNGWTVKNGSKREPMKNYKSAINTFIRNLKSYNKELYVALVKFRLDADSK